MTEAEFAGLTDRYLDGTLTGPQREALAAHVAGSPASLAAFETQVRLHVTLTALLTAGKTPADRRAELILADAEDRGDQTLGRLRARLSIPAPRWRGRRLGRAAGVGLSIAALIALGVALGWPAGRPPAIPTAHQSVHIESVRGDVVVSTVGRENPAVAGMALAAGCRVHARGDESVVVLHYSDDTRLKLEGGTSVALLTGPGKRVALEEGVLAADVPPQPPDLPLTVQTPRAELLVPAARFVSVASSAATRVEPQTGRLELLSAAGQTTEIPAGTYAVVSADIAAMTTPAVPVRSGVARLTLAVGGGPVRPVAFAADGSAVAVGTWDGKVQFWSPAAGTLLLTLDAFPRRVSALAFSKDGTRLAAATDDLPNQVATVGVWDLKSGQRLFALAGLGNVKAVAFSPDGGLLAAGGYNGPDAPGTLLWDMRGGEPLGSLDGLAGETPALVFSPDGGTLVTGHGDGSVRLWDPTKRTAKRCLGRHATWVSGLAFSPDGRTLLSGSHDYTIRLWEVATGAERACLPGPGGRVRSVAFSPDGSAVAAASGPLATVWDVVTGVERVTFEAGDYTVSGVAFGPGGRTLATTGWKGTAKLWTVPPQGGRFE